MFSVIIPLYNKELHIRYTTESVLSQTYNNFELIVVNDGSTDNSLKIVQAISDPRIEIIDKPNGGESSARNAGIRVAKHKYIALLDADDYWDENFLLTMMKLIGDYPEASVFGCQFYSKNSNTLQILNEVHSKRGIIENYFQAQMLAPVLCSSNIVVKKECFDSIGYFNTKLIRGGDLEMWVRLAKNYKIAFEPKPLSYYIQDSENRACHNIPPLENFYLEDNLTIKPYWERKYCLTLVEWVMSEMLINKKFKNLFSLIIRYNTYTPIAFFNIIKKLVFYKFNQWKKILRSK